MPSRSLVLAALSFAIGDRASTSTVAPREGERPGYFVPGPADGPLALLGYARLGVSGKRVEFSGQRARLGGKRQDCVDPAYGRRGRFIPATCELEAPLSSFVVRDAGHTR